MLDAIPSDSEQKNFKVQDEPVEELITKVDEDGTAKFEILLDDHCGEGHYILCLTDISKTTDILNPHLLVFQYSVKKRKK